MAGWESMEQAAEYGRGLLVGERVRLRALTDADLPQLEAWWLNPATVALQANTIRPMPPGPIREMFRKWSSNETPAAVGFCVVTVERGELLGHVSLWGDDPRNRAATMAIVIGEEHTGNGYGPEALRLLMRYGFSELGLHRIELGVYAYNTRAAAVYRRLGFTEEGRRREAVLHDGVFHDSIVMAMLQPEWRDRYGTSGAETGSRAAQESRRDAGRTAEG
jgi:RimJ/RimL family protein N-acetyltransferase